MFSVWFLSGTINCKKPLTIATVCGIMSAGGEQAASVEKIVDKMKSQPTGIRPDEAGQVLVCYGYEFDRQNGSHKAYVNKAGMCN